MTTAARSLRSANGAAPCQPRATPWELRPPCEQGLKARGKRRAVESGLQPLGICGPVTQGVALGWYEAGALPLRTGTTDAPDAEGDALSLSKRGLLA